MKHSKTSKSHFIVLLNFSHKYTTIFVPLFIYLFCTTFLLNNIIQNWKSPLTIPGTFLDRLRYNSSLKKKTVMKSVMSVMVVWMMWICPPSRGALTILTF